MEITVTSIEEYLQAIKKIKISENVPLLWFRGQNRSEYRLLTPEARLSFKTTESLLIIPGFLKHLNDFKDFCKKQCRKQLKVLGNPKDDLEWSFLAQHCGAPTLLLDWTEDPMIALFFAINKLDPSDTGVNVFVCSPENLNHSVSDNTPVQNFHGPVPVTEETRDYLLRYIHFENTPSLPLCIKPSIQNYRLTRQSGNFIIQGKDFTPFDLQDCGKFFHKIIIPRERFSYFKELLDLLQLNEQTIYGPQTPADEYARELRKLVEEKFIDTKRYFVNSQKNLPLDKVSTQQYSNNK